MDIQNFLDRVLLHVKTPSQYIGHEWNSVYKDLSTVKTRFCLSYPDTYPVGMSYHGLKLLYEIINSFPDLVCERTFAPLPDFIQYLKKYNIPLFSLESRVPVRSFHIWGFSVCTEINWTNFLEMLQCAGVPVWAKERTEDDPIIIAGGHGVYNPEPAAPFLDLVAFGDGEEQLPALLHLDAELREKKLSRQERIVEIARNIRGIYAPNYYDIHYHPDGTIAEIKPQKGLPERIEAQYIDDLDKFHSVKPLVGYRDTVHNRIFLEIMRGCTNGCRFCQAGMIRRPLRIRSVDALVKDAMEIYKNTGYDEICLYSLASSDYPYLDELTKKVLEIFAPLGVGISVPSLRINEELKNLQGAMASVRKSGLTLAPEVGTERMQNIVNKVISHQEMLDAVEDAYQKGWDSIKLYFMIGLPYQDDEDYKRIVDLLYQVSERRKKIGKGPGWVSASISNFVPKPQTPFQWAPMLTSEAIRQIHKRMKSAMRSPKIKIAFHEPFFTNLEAIVARGDRRVAQAIYYAWQGGAYLDAWGEHFRKDAWKNAFQKTAITPEFYLYREIPETEKLPWSHIGCGVSNDFLWKEWQKAKKGETTAKCTDDKCNQCGIDVKLCIKGRTCKNATCKTE